MSYVISIFCIFFQFFLLLYNDYIFTVYWKQNQFVVMKYSQLVISVIFVMLFYEKKYNEICLLATGIISLQIKRTRFRCIKQVYCSEALHMPFFMFVH